MTKGDEMGRPTIRKDGTPLTGAEREARRRKRVGKSINRTRRKQRKDAKLAPQLAAREARRNALIIPDGMDYRIGDCREVLADIPDDSVALILTDPPYGNASEPLYRWLAQFAARVLMPGGSLICVTGLMRLDHEMAIFGEHLRYLPQCVMLHDQQQRIFGANANITVGHKPVLHYAKGHRRKLPSGTRLLPTVWRSGGKDKSLHLWAQGDGGVWIPIDCLTDPGELIVEPFCGPGEWGRIAHQMGRRWIGADVAQWGKTTIAA
jgi:hypothetical protein